MQQMKVQDLTELFVECVLSRDDAASYESSFPALFNHYYRYWSLRQAYSNQTTAEQVRQNGQLLQLRLPLLVERFSHQSLSLDEEEIVLFVGHDVSNGHVFSHEDRLITWLPVEAYPSELVVDVFVAHELAHALHYRSVPEFYFGSTREKNLLGRQLVTEGIATLVSMEVNEVDQATALWADYIPYSKAQAWLRQCEDQQQALAYFAWSHFDESSEGNAFFSLQDENDVFQYRGGYYLGLRVVQDLQKQYGLDLQGLLCLERNQLEGDVKQQLKRIAHRL